MAADPKVQAKVQAFRNKHERLLRRMVTIACCVSGCINDGNDVQEEAEMNAFSRVAMDLVEAAKRQPKRTTVQLVSLEERRSTQ